jgi:hypothetical protein
MLKLFSAAIGNTLSYKTPVPTPFLSKCKKKLSAICLYSSVCWAFDFKPKINEIKASK